MKNKLLILVLVVFITGGLFSQEADSDEVHKYEPFDMLIGLNMGFGFTPNIFSVLSGDISKGNYGLVFDFGLTYDFYLYNWLSFNSGLILHPGIYVFAATELKNVDSFTDFAATPLCLTIPLMAHVNVPYVEWLYAGIGLTLNFPITSMLDQAAGTAGMDLKVDTKGKFFVGVPIDIGFDWIKPGKGGKRFFFRIMPEFHDGGTVVPIGLIWQVWNWKIYSRN